MDRDSLDLSCCLGSATGNLSDPEQVISFSQVSVSSPAHDNVRFAGVFLSFLFNLTQYEVTHSNLYLIFSFHN